MKVQVTLEFEIQDDSDAGEILQLLKTRIKNFDYQNEFVSSTFITSPEKTILYKENRLEHLEQAISAFQELLEPNPSNRCIEADQLLYQHHKQARDLKKTKQDYSELESFYHELNQLKWMGEDEGWDLAIAKVREEIAKKLKQK